MIYYTPIISHELWRDRHFLELYPLDGGGSFINRAILGTIDDREIRRKFLAGGLSRTLDFPNMDFHRYERWRSIELSCWVNRCYLVACLAHAAWLENDSHLARIIKENILHFLDTCPAPGDGAPGEIAAHWQRVEYRMTHDYNEKNYEEYSKDETDVEYIWYDFQPASRVINFLTALFFIQDLADFRPGEIERLLAGIRLHGRIIFLQEKFLPCQQGNHQAIRQIGLLHAAAAFPDDEETRQWKTLALDRIAWHALNDFFPNGVLFENSPSYHSFETWHGRDAMAFARRFAMPLAPEAERRFKQAGQVLATYRRPDGKTLVINDAYPLLPDGLLESMAIDARSQPRTSFLDYGGLAVWRGKRLYAALDVSSFTGNFSHYHAGKNAIMLFVDSTPFLDDPGCCNYDAPGFRACKQAGRHSSLLVDGAPDAHSYSIYGWDSYPTLEISPWENNRFSAVLHSSTPEWQYVSWRRTMVCQDDSLQLTDEIIAPEPHAYELRFTLAPGITVKETANAFLLTNEKNTLQMTVGGANDYTVRLADCENYQTDPALPARQFRLLFAKQSSLHSLVSFKVLS